MAMKNKWLCLFTVILMVVSISGFAIIADATGVPTITVSKVQGVVGQNVSVNLSIENNPGLAGATFQVVFDNSILTLESVTYNEADFGKDFEPVGNYLSPVNIAWSSMSNVTNNGVFLTLNFKIKEDTSAGNITTIGVLYSLGDFCDINEKDVLFEISDGVIMLIDSFPGDITGDGLVNSKDLIRLRKYFSGWDVEVDMTACDCNGDGNVNSKDLIRLRKHFSGWNVELLYGPINTVVECAHSLSHVAACDSKCDEDGNTEYWHCTKCGKYFSDADGKNEITLASTIIPSVGHTVVIDEAVPPTYDTTGLSEGSHCSVCEKIIKNQNVIPKLEAIYHSITYRNTKDAVIAVEKMKYAEHEGLIELPEPIVKGYVFKGWYTQSVGGELID